MTKDEYYFNHYHQEHPDNRDERDMDGMWSRSQGQVINYNWHDDNPLICFGDNMCCSQDTCDTCIFWIWLFDEPYNP